MLYHTSINRMINDLRHAIFGNGVVTKLDRQYKGRKGEWRKKKRLTLSQPFGFSYLALYCCLQITLAYRLVGCF